MENNKDRKEKLGSRGISRYAAALFSFIHKIHVFKRRHLYSADAAAEAQREQQCDQKRRKARAVENRRFDPSLPTSHRLVLLSFCRFLIRKKHTVKCAYGLIAFI